MPFGIVAYALMLFSWTTFIETAVNTEQSVGWLTFSFVYVKVYVHTTFSELICTAHTVERRYVVFPLLHL